MFNPAHQPLGKVHRVYLGKKHETKDNQKPITDRVEYTLNLHFVTEKVSQRFGLIRIMLCTYANLIQTLQILVFYAHEHKQIHSMNIEEVLNQTSRNLELFQLNTANNQNYPFPL